MTATLEIVPSQSSNRPGFCGWVKDILWKFSIKPCASSSAAKPVRSKCAKPKLLIIDELGYLPSEPDAAHLFFQLVSRRYERGAILLTSNRSVGEWGAAERACLWCINYDGISH